MKYLKICDGLCVVLLLLFACSSFPARLDAQQEISCTTQIPNPDSKGSSTASVIDLDRKWTTGSTIRIRFLNASTSQIKTVMGFADDWFRFANLNYRIVANGDAEIRIRIADAGIGNNSEIGTNALTISQSVPTMNLYNWNHGGTVRHEFGHALGLLHEHQSPAADYDWNVAEVLKRYKQSDGWEPDKVRSNILNVATGNLAYTELDKESVMHYSIDRGLLKDDSYVVGSSFVSLRDKMMIGSLYPFPWGTGHNKSDPTDIAHFSTESQLQLYKISNGEIFVRQLTGLALGSWKSWGKLQDQGSKYVVLDFNNDGKEDVGEFYSNSLYIHFSNDQRFDAAKKLGTGYNISDLTLFDDLNGDSLPDAFKVSNGTAFVQLSTGAAMGSWTEWGTGFNESDPAFLIDINSDGLADACKYSSGILYVALSNGAQFDTWRSWGSGHNESDPTTFLDIDGDGRLDAIKSSNDKLWARFNEGSSLSSWQDLGSGAIEFIGDFNGDGRDDIAEVANGKILVRTSEGKTFGQRRPWSYYGHDGNTLIGDINGDGRDDVIRLIYSIGWSIPEVSDGFRFLNLRMAAESGAVSIGVPYPQKVSPVSYEVNVDLTRTLVWENVSGFDRSAVTINESLLNSADTVEASTSGFKPLLRYGRYYTWNVGSITSNDTLWGLPYAFSTIMDTPTISTDNTATISEDDPIAWEGGSDALYHRIQASVMMPDSTELVLEDSVVDSRPFYLPVLPERSRVIFTVSSQYPIGESSTDHTFTTSWSSGAPVYPVDTNIDYGPITFVWQPKWNDVTYSLQLCQDTLDIDNTELFRRDGIDDSIMTVDLAAGSGKVYWRIRGIGLESVSEWSSFHNFNVSDSIGAVMFANNLSDQSNIQVTVTREDRIHLISDLVLRVARIELFSVTGNLIMANSETKSGPTIDIDIPTCPHGLYFLRLHCFQKGVINFMIQL